MAQQDYAGIKWIMSMGRILSILAALSAAVFALLRLGVLGPTGENAAPTEAVYASTVSTRQYDSNLFGNITISSQEQLSLAKAVLSINGENCGDFSQGEVTVRVYPDDVLAVDASAYQRELSFYIVQVSPSIRRELLQENLYCCGDIREFGKIEFK